MSLLQDLDLAANQNTYISKESVRSAINDATVFVSLAREFNLIEASQEDEYVKKVILHSMTVAPSYTGIQFFSAFGIEAQMPVENHPPIPGVPPLPDSYVQPIAPST